MSKLNVHLYDHSRFMLEVAELVEDILGRPVCEIEDWSRLLNEARSELNRMRASVAMPTKTLALPLDK